MYSRLVVPLDGSDFGEHAITAAAAIARRARAEIELVHVHQQHDAEPYLGGITAYHWQGEPLWQARHDRARLEEEHDKLRTRAARLTAEHGVAATCRVLEGRVPLALQREVELHDADLVVMATHARHGVSRWRYGSMGDAFVRHSNVPTLLVRPAERAPRDVEFRRILVALDGSAFSEEVLQPALRLAGLLDAEVTLFHVVTRPGHWGGHSYQRPHEPIAQLRSDSDVYLRDVADRFAASYPRLAVRTAVAEHAASCIAQAAGDLRYDMIALATHGRGGVSRLLLGSTADQLLAMTWTPVLALRPGALRAPSIVPEAAVQPAPAPLA